MIVIKYIWYYTVWLLIKLGTLMYFSKIKVTGKEKIPKGVPIMFGSNHENAFLDALVMTTCNTLFDHFLVRADVFNNKVAKFFLDSLNMMPVYRIRDGVSSVKANDRAFEACYQVLAKGHSIILFPEANHDIRRIKRVIKKGVARIAYGAVNYEGGAEEICIMPMGLNYSNHTAFRSTVHVVYGDPIYLKREESSKEKIEELRLKLNHAMSQCHVALDRGSYDVLDTIFFHDQHIHSLIDPKEINAKAEEVSSKIHDSESILKEKEALISRGVKFPYCPPTPTEWFRFIYLAPMALIGSILNAPIIWPVHWLVTSKIKDRAFQSSIYFGPSIFLLPWWWWFLCNSIYNYTQNGLLTGLTLLTLVITLVSIGSFKDLWKRFRIRRVIHSNPDLKKDYQNFAKKIEGLRKG